MWCPCSIVKGKNDPVDTWSLPPVLPSDCSCEDIPSGTGCWRELVGSNWLEIAGQSLASADVQLHSEEGRQLETGQVGISPVWSCLWRSFSSPLPKGLPLSKGLVFLEQVRAKPTLPWQGAYVVFWTQLWLKCVATLAPGQFSRSASAYRWDTQLRLDSGHLWAGRKLPARESWGLHAMSPSL